jgi:NADH-quinone oxidoreductase subunit J
VSEATVPVMTAYLLYAVFAIGGVGLCLMLPQGERTRPLAGGLIGLAALAMLLMLVATRFVPPDGSSPYFYLFAAIAIASAVRVITHPRPVYSALYFVLTVIAVASLMVLQRAEFLAVALVIIYAGAILVTYLFVIMLAYSGGSPVYDRQAREPMLTVFTCFLLMAAIAVHAGELPASRAASFSSREPAPVETFRSPAAIDEPTMALTPAEKEPPRAMGNTLAVGRMLMTRHVVTLEIGAVLLLVAMVGAIAMSRRRVKSEVPRMPARPLGQIGKEVEPF